MGDKDKVFIPQKNSSSIRSSTWKDAINRLKPEVMPEHVPSFSIDKNEKIFTIGSCFLRHIEEYLDMYGFNVPMMSFKVPNHEWPNRPNGILNKYSPATIFQELEWCEQVYIQGGKVTPAHIDRLLYACDDGLVIDMNLTGYVPVTRERALERRQQIYNIFEQVLSSPTVIMTFTLLEVWYDRQHNRIIERVPSERMSRSNERFKFIYLKYNECCDYLQKSISLVRKYRSDSKFLLMTCPVPLKETFSGKDIIIANMYSKSVLRAMCGAITSSNEDVDYFPAYEIVSLTKNWDTTEEDLRHVSDKYIKKIVDKLIDSYFVKL